MIELTSLGAAICTDATISLDVTAGAEVDVGLAERDERLGQGGRGQGDSPTAAVIMFLFVLVVRLASLANCESLTSWACRSTPSCWRTIRKVSSRVRRRTRGRELRRAASAAAPVLSRRSRRHPRRRAPQARVLRLAPPLSGWPGPVPPTPCQARSRPARAGRGSGVCIAASKVQRTSVSRQGPAALPRLSRLAGQSLYRPAQARVSFNVALGCVRAVGRASEGSICSPSTGGRADSSWTVGRISASKRRVGHGRDRFSDRQGSDQDRLKSRAQPDLKKGWSEADEDSVSLFLLGRGLSGRQAQKVRSISFCVILTGPQYNKGRKRLD